MNKTDPTTMRDISNAGLKIHKRFPMFRSQTDDTQGIATQKCSFQNLNRTSLLFAILHALLISRAAE